jgi:alpha-L-rhamnosidase
MPVVRAELTREQRIGWWREARFGMFVHWGLYAIPGGVWKDKVHPAGYSEWIMFDEKIPVKEYEKLAGRFNPVQFDARAWAAIAKRAGMKYMVLTTKHHDGFCMFKSSLTPYSIADATPFKRDVTGELSDACREAGLRFGCYYSIDRDWYRPLGPGNRYKQANDWDYPASKREDFDRYFTSFAKPQVEELLTKYRPDVVWFDEIDMKTDAQVEDLYQAVRALRPECVINSRIQGCVPPKTMPPAHCDYLSTGDNQIADTNLGFDWENPGSMNTSYGFNANDHKWVSAAGVVSNLVDIVSKGGNYLLNVGPTPEGLIPQPCVERLAEVGAWMDVNGEAIYGTSPWRVWRAKDDASGRELRFTAKGGLVYVFCWPGEAGTLQIGSLGKEQMPGQEIVSVSVLGSSEKIQWTQTADRFAVPAARVKPGAFPYVLRIEAGERTDPAGSGPEAAQPVSHVLVTDLRCEYLADPLGIDTPQPRFSWNLVDPAKTRGQRQTAYRIVVESRSVGGAESKVVLWDSGRVASSQSVNTVYAGAVLTSGRDCVWRVRVWDKDGRTTAWSADARFSVGLLDPSDWKGEWIRYKEADNTKHIWYRKTFALDGVPARAFAYLCSIGYHELYVNGQRIGTRVLSPEVSNLSKRAIYVTYDITGWLRKGGNVIAVWTGPGWARADGSYGKGVWKQDSIFKCQVNLSNGVALQSDGTWKCRVSSSENLGLWKGGGEGEYGGELIDARRHIPEWNQPSYDDAGWTNATVYAKSLILSASMQEPDRKVEALRPVSMTGTNGQYIFDMGRNFTGWIECDLRNGKAGDVVKFMTANSPGAIVEYNQESRYIHDASGAGTFCHRFNYTAGRWITVAGLSLRPEPGDLRCYIVTNDRKRIGSFECSNGLFNRIYETDLRTYLACTVNGVTMDCPHRERFGYGEVALACSWGCGIPNFESAVFYRKAARDWFDVQREDGFVNTIAPQTYKGAGGTLWSSGPVTLSWEFFKAYGDKRLLEEAYLPMKKWLDFLNGSISSNGVLVAYESPSRFLGDWATPHGSEYGGTPEAKLFNNGVYAYCLNAFVQAAGILGRSEDVRTYSRRLAELRTNAHKHFFNEDSKTYIDGRQLAMAFPLYTGITPETERPAVLRNLVAEFRRKPYLDTGSSGLPILLKFIVEDSERADLLFPCLARTEYPGYGFFLESGESTWPEYWKITGEPSRIHTCYTGIAGYFIKAIGGIRPDPDEWGMRKFLIKPKLVGSLTYANTTSGSQYGRIVCDWTRSGKTATFNVEVPVNATATIYIPTKEPSSVEESGKLAAGSEGVTLRGKEGGAAVFAVGSGAYRFTCSDVGVSAPE